MGGVGLSSSSRGAGTDLTHDLVLRELQSGHFLVRSESNVFRYIESIAPLCFQLPLHVPPPSPILLPEEEPEALYTDGLVYHTTFQNSSLYRCKRH